MICCTSVLATCLVYWLHVLYIGFSNLIVILVTASHFGDSSALPGFCIACAFRVCGMVISRELRNKLVLKVRLEFTRLYRRGLQPAHELVMSFSRSLLQTVNKQELLAYHANQWRPPWWNDVYFQKCLPHVAWR